MELMTNSRLDAFRTCSKLHYLRYERLRRPIRKPRAPAFGTIAHAGLEGWWRAWMDNSVQPTAKVVPLTAALNASRLAYREGAGEADLDDFELVRCEELLAGYDVRWGDWMAGVTVLSVEAQFECPLVNPRTGRASQTYGLGGKLDVLLVMPDGSVWFMEHKTTASDIDPGADYWTRLRMDSQISTYFDGAASLGEEPKGCVYDVVRKPAIRPLKATPEESRKYTKGKACKVCRGASTSIPCSACNGSGWEQAPRLYSAQRTEDETLDEFRLRVRAAVGEDPNNWYQRGEVVRLDSEMFSFRADTWVTAKALRGCQLEERELGPDAWPRNPGACYRFSRFCEYYEACNPGNESAIDDDEKFRNSIRHEELDASNT